MTLFRHPADRLPVILILGLTALDATIYVCVQSAWVLAGYFVLALIPKGCICAWNHHHQHTRTFHGRVLNRALELSYALHTGVTTNLWLLHHVLGHHHNYLDQSRDESRWQRRDGSTMGIIEYTFNVALTAYYRGYKVGRRYPKHYRTHLIYTLLAFAVAGGLTVYQPLQGFLLFLLPMVSGMLITAWATYDHHAGLATEDHFEASYNNMNRLFNTLTGNLGYHTAHHFKQGLHWSELPRLHDSIKHRIPDELYVHSLWDVVSSFGGLRTTGGGVRSA